MRYLKVTYYGVRAILGRVWLLATVPYCMLGYYRPSFIVALWVANNDQRLTEAWEGQ